MADEKKLTLSEAKEKIEGWKDRVGKMRDRAAKGVTKLVHTGEAQGGAFLSGLLVGYNDGSPLQVQGVDVDLILGGGLVALSLAEGAGEDHLLALGNGITSGFSYRGGVKMGTRIKSNKKSGKSLFAGGEEAPQLGAGEREYGSESEHVHHGEIVRR